MKSWIGISRGRLAANFAATLELARRGAEAVDLLAVVKADAYGHGAVLCAPVLAAAGAPWLGVTDAAEGARVREALCSAGLPRAAQPRVLVMCGHLPEEAPVLVRHGLTPVVWTVRQLEALAAAGPVEVHLEVDTGMSRQGVAVGEGLRELLRWFADEPRVRLKGVMTHFASAEVVGSAQTRAQREGFEAAIGMVEAAGLRVGWVHAGNTSGLDAGHNAGHDAGLDAGHDAGPELVPWLAGLAARVGGRAMVREGLGLYGYCLPLSEPGASLLRARVLPVLTWRTRLLAVSEVEAGAGVGYNGIFTASEPMRLGLLPVGYADGLRRELSSGEGRSGGWVRIRGERAPVVGRISMNLTTVDLTGLTAAEGDEVVLLGEGVTAEDHAGLAGTIPYEILCGIRATSLLED